MIYCGKHLISPAKDKSMNRLTRPGAGSYYSLYSATMSKVSWSIVLIKKKKSKISQAKTECYSTHLGPMDSKGTSMLPNMMMKSSRQEDN